MTHTWRKNLNSWSEGSDIEGFKENADFKFVYERNNLWTPGELTGRRRIGPCLPGPNSNVWLPVHLPVLGWTK